MSALLTFAGCPMPRGCRNDRFRELHRGVGMTRQGLQWAEPRRAWGDQALATAAQPQWTAAGFVDTELGLHGSILERHGA